MVSLSPSMRILLSDAVSSGQVVAHGPEILTARALRRRGLLVGRGVSPSGRGWTYEPTDEGRAVVRGWSSAANDRADEPETDVAAYGRREP